MSAWIVSKAHIDVLVDALAKREMVFGQGLDDMGRILWEENHKSVNCRYNESTPTPPYTFAKPVLEWSEGALLTEIGCYDYQTCEHEEYSQSQAKFAMDALAQALTENGAERDNEAPWGVCECGGWHPDYRCPSREDVG